MDSKNWKNDTSMKNYSTKARIGSCIDSPRREHSESHRDFGYSWVLSLRRFVRYRWGRSTGSDEISAEFQKSAGEVDIEWMIGLFNVIFRMSKRPEE